MKKDFYTYIAVVSLEKDDSRPNEYYAAYVPNFGEVYTDGENLEELLKNITECLEFGIYGREKDNEDLPDPINPIEYKDKLNDNEFLMSVNAIMPRVRKAFDNISIKKTLTIPQWLNIEAMKQNLNFSQILQDALKKELGIVEKY
ncbi:MULTISPECIES: type II toxin-antitoxin system HicB family antitoxin [Romboutsia]|uniref:type II toxin-antitoxin system HicB family antitoxin n=1 Tax=Romboutsia TaxID=1501226 RepID=UPI000AB501F8|nr:MULTISPECIES: type II toxin-antitoxin system HicB family antitoxin [Romboutsia]